MGNMCAKKNTPMVETGALKKNPDGPKGPVTTMSKTSEASEKKQKEV